jgi:alkylation response protein AidB-like acyl-CoA dehydrogenase
MPTGFSVWCAPIRPPRSRKAFRFLLIDMKTPGITVRPIQTIDGGHEVNEVFFDDVKVPAENLVGQENKGWDYAKFLLGNERTGIARVGASKARIRRLKELAALEQSGGKPLIADERFRAKIAAVEVELKALEMTQLRVVAAERTRATAATSPIRPRPFSRSKARRFSRRSPSCLLEVVGPYALPDQTRTTRANAGTSRRSARNGPARWRRNISTTARPRSTAARTRSRRTSSPRRFWGCDVIPSLRARSGEAIQ